MEISNYRAAYRSLPVALFAFAAAVSANDVAVTRKPADFDITQPARENARGQVIEASLIADAMQRAWLQASGQAIAALVQWMSAPDRLGAGRTARGIGITFGTPAAIVMQPVDAAGLGRFSVTIPGNRLDLISSHPVSHGNWMDPRVRLIFDLTLAVDFSAAAGSAPIRANHASVTAGKVMVVPLNELAALDFPADRPVSSADTTAPTVALVRDVFRSVRLPVAAAFNDQLRVLTGYPALSRGATFSAVAVEASR